MPRTLFTLLLLLFLTPLTVVQISCTREPGTAHAEGYPQSPEGVVKGLVEATNARDEKLLLTFFTAAARQGLESGDGFNVDQGFENVEVSDAEISRDSAEVPTSLEKNGKKQDLRFSMRKEDSQWRIYAITVTTDGMTMTLDFEKLGSMLDAFGSALQEDMQSSFEEAARGGSAREIAEKKAAFQAIQPTSRDKFSALWTNTRDFRDQSAGDALDALTASLDLVVHRGEYTELWARTVESDVQGMSHLEAIEVIAVELGLYPEYPSSTGMGGRFVSAMTSALAQRLTGENSAITIDGVDATTRDASPADNAVVFRQGARPWPVTFAGPFRIDVADVQENVPHATGSISIAVSARAVDLGILTLLAEHREPTTFDKVVDRKGRSLRARDDVRFMGGGQVVANSFETVFPIELKNFLRDVDSIASLNGTQKISLATEMKTVEFEKLGVGQEKKVGELTLKVKQAGENTTIDITGPQATLSSLLVRFWALDDAGEDVGILYQDCAMWMKDKAQASVQTAKTPSKLLLKIITAREEIEYPFDLRDIPLARHTEMPEKIEALTFAGHATPIDVSFRKFESTETPIPTVVLEAINRSNKDILVAHVKFHYLDANGKELADCSTSLTAGFSSEGQAPVVARQSNARVNTSAFFMPKEAKTVRVVVFRVEFVDGTAWDQEP